MGFAQELLTSKCEEMLQSNQVDCIAETTPSAPKQARKDDTDSVLWAQVDEISQNATVDKRNILVAPEVLRNQ